MGITDPIGKTIDYLNIPGWGARKLIIVGEVRDFHYGSMKEPIAPMVFIQDNALPLGKILMRLRPDKVQHTLVLLDKAYHLLNPDRPFSYVFADEANRKACEPEYRWRQIITWGSVVTILVACTGLFGFSLLVVQRRRKEISIRKVVGASIWQLVTVVVREFGNLVLIASLIAAPISFEVIHRWLQEYPYRVELSWWRFGAAGLIVWSIVILTAGYHAIRAARANPVHSLKIDNQ
jgi:putative ABC transport system permease protein